MTYILRKGHSVLDDLSDGNLAKSVNTQGAKSIFYVDGNAGDDSWDGLSWGNAFKTLAAGLAASHADIASGAPGWAARNIVYCKGDAFEEDLVLLAQKTDVIGVGSYNANAKCGLIGNHIPTGAATCAYGTRFFNMHFKAGAEGGDIWTFDTHSVQPAFIGCEFVADSTTAATGAIVTAATDFLRIIGCEFRGAFSDCTIEIGDGDCRGLRIIDNYIEGAVGIEIATGATISHSMNPLIKDNVISATGLTIDDEDNTSRVVGNYLISAATTTATAVDINLPTSAGNYLSFATVNSVYPYVDSSS